MAESITLGSIVYAIQARNEDFKRIVADSEAKLNNFNKKVQDSGKKLMAWGAGITATSTAVIAAFQLMAKSTAEGVETLEKYSIQTGMSTQALQKWGYAAKLNKASMDQLAQGLVFLARSMRSADLESVAAQQAFDELNIQTKDGQGNFRNLGDILDDIRERMSKMANGAEKTALATKLFGRGAADLVPVLSLSREEFEELSREAERLHIILTAENIKDFGEFKDTLEEVEEGMSGLKMQISAAVLPAMQDMISVVKNAIIWFNKLPEPIKRGIPQLALMAATIGMIAGPIMLVMGLWSKFRALIISNAIVVAIRNTTAAIAAMNAGSAAASSAMTFMAASFTPFLVGGAIALGLIAIVGILKQVAENAKYTRMQIANITNIAELEKARSATEASLHFLEQKRKAADMIARQTGDELNPSKGYYSQDWTQQNEADLQAARAKLRGIDKRISDLTKSLETDLGGGNNSVENQLQLSEQLLIEHLQRMGELRQADIEEENQRYKEELETARGNSTLMEEVEQGHQERLNAIDKKYLQERKELQQSYDKELFDLTHSDYEARLHDLEIEENKALDKVKHDTDLQLSTVKTFQLKRKQIQEEFTDQKMEELNREATYERQMGLLSIEDYNAELQKYKAYLEQRLKDYEEYSDKWIEITQKIQQTNEKLSVSTADSWQKGLNESTLDWDNWGRHVEDIAASAAYGMERSFSNFFSDALRGELKSLGDYFKSFLDSIVDAWSRAMAEMITKQILVNMFDGTSISLPGNYGIEGRAIGGSVYARGTYLVGEKGPELLTMGSNSGYITPNNQLGVPNIQVNVINKGQELKTTGQSIEFDGDQYIINVVTEAAVTNKGGLRDILEATRK